MIQEDVIQEASVAVETPKSFCTKTNKGNMMLVSKASKAHPIASNEVAQVCHRLHWRLSSREVALVSHWTAGISSHVMVGRPISFFGVSMEMSFARLKAHGQALKAVSQHGERHATGIQLLRVGLEPRPSTEEMRKRGNWPSQTKEISMDRMDA